MRLKVTFAVLNFCNVHNLGNIVFELRCLCINLEVHSTCDLNFIVKDEGLLKVTGSHVHWKSGNISEIVLDGDVVTTGH